MIVLSSSRLKRNIDSWRVKESLWICFANIPPSIWITVFFLFNTKLISNLKRKSAYPLYQFLNLFLVALDRTNEEVFLQYTWLLKTQPKSARGSCISSSWCCIMLFAIFFSFAVERRFNPLLCVITLNVWPTNITFCSKHYISSMRSICTVLFAWPVASSKLNHKLLFVYKFLLISA